jgi:MoxR-like ATPase
MSFLNHLFGTKHSVNADAEPGTASDQHSSSVTDNTTDAEESKQADTDIGNEISGEENAFTSNDLIMQTEETFDTGPEKFIPEEFKYLEELIVYRIKKNFGEHMHSPAPSLPEACLIDLHAKFFSNEKKNKHAGGQQQLDEEEAGLLLLALAPHVRPDLLDNAISSGLKDTGEFPQIGGVRPDGKNFRGFLPTGQTALFVLAGDDNDKQLKVRKLFGADHFFSRKKMLWLEELSPGEPAMSGKIIMSPDYIDIFLHGEASAPHFSSSFPAKLLEEKRKRGSLIVNKELEMQIDEIVSWVENHEDLEDKYEMSDRVKKGYRALFYGPPGTGKTFTAGILGNELTPKRDVYRIDISMVVSKYIGETEKNLELLFARAEDKGWILFFDEADALFGKRTDVRDAHDKYANQEVSYLLQRIEDYNGLIILATNRKNNIDEAFIRRFNAILKFSFPDANERAGIWEKSFSEKVEFVKEIPVSNDVKNDAKEAEKNKTAHECEKSFYKMDQAVKEASIPVHKKNATAPLTKKEMFDLLKKYEVSGGNIINIVHYASLKAVERQKTKQEAAAKMHEEANKDNTGQEPNPKETKLIVYISDVIHGIKKELTKEGKPFVEIIEKKNTLSNSKKETAI